MNIVIVIGDLNGKVGQSADGNTVGRFELGERNERGKMNDQITMNTYFKRLLWT